MYGLAVKRLADIPPGPCLPKYKTVDVSVLPVMYHDTADPSKLLDYMGICVGIT